MRKFFFLVLFLPLLAIPTSEAARPTILNQALGTLLDDVALNAAEATRTTSVRTLPGHNNLLLFIQYTNSAATDVKVVCRSYYDDTDSTAYIIQSGDATTWPTIKYDDWEFHKDVSANANWVIPVPMLGHKIDCIFSGTSADGSDKVTVKGRAVSM